jgi:hypothetical protein
MSPAIIPLKEPLRARAWPRKVLAVFLPKERAVTLANALYQPNVLSINSVTVL